MKQTTNLLNRLREQLILQISTSIREQLPQPMSNTIASRTFGSDSGFPITKAPITSNPFKSRARRSSDSLRRSGALEGERAWMHRAVEIVVSGGKNADPISHWRPGSFLCGRRSFGHRTHTD